MARTGDREIRRPEDWFPPGRPTATPSTGDVNAKIAAALVPGIQLIGSAPTVIPTFADELVDITALAEDVEFDNPTGTAVNGKRITIRIKDDGTPHAISYDTEYRQVGITLPIITVANKLRYLFMMWNESDSMWDVYQTVLEV